MIKCKIQNVKTRNVKGGVLRIQDLCFYVLHSTFLILYFKQ